MTDRLHPSEKPAPEPTLAPLGLQCRGCGFYDGHARNCKRSRTLTTPPETRMDEETERIIANVRQWDHNAQPETIAALRSRIALLIERERNEAGRRIAELEKRDKAFGYRRDEFRYDKDPYDR